jgi:hypothetical protein
MLRKLSCVGVLCALAVVPALAQEGETKGEAGTEQATPEEKTTPDSGVRHGWGVAVHWLEGGAIAQTADNVAPPIKGLETPPTLGDSFGIAGFYYYEVKPNLMTEFRLTLGSSDVDHVCPDADDDSTGNVFPSDCKAKEKSVSAIVGALDFILVPHWKVGPIDLGVPFGFGWGFVRSSEVYAPAGYVETRNHSVVMESSSGMNYFIGLRPTWQIAKGRALFAEVRAIRFHRLVNVNARTLKSFEASVGIRFPLGG